MVDWIHNEAGECVADLILPVSHMEMVFHRVIPKSIHESVRANSMSRANKTAKHESFELSEDSIAIIKEVYQADFELYQKACGQ